MSETTPKATQKGRPPSYKTEAEKKEIRARHNKKYYEKVKRKIQSDIQEPMKIGE